MRQIALLILSIFSAAFLILHKIALNLFWYWKYKWFDIPMHFIGGAIVAVLFLYIYLLLFEKSPFRWSSDGHFFVMVILTLGVGIIWESLETIFGIEVLKSGYATDTLTDLFMDTAGAFCMYLLTYKPMKNYSTRKLEI